ARLLEVFSIHAQIEDRLYYLRIRDVTPLFPIAHAEHRQIDEQFAALLRTDPSSGDFKVEAQMLASVLGRHADEEEEEVFPQVQDRMDGTTLDRLGHELSAFHARLHRSPVTRTRIRLKGEVLRRLP
ncbi:MAG: hemerythrin domain-containing protein, partial [Mycobacterium sp.]|nr:hemerythrin domain-containing protein [Mycobacterium sp.]